MQRGVLKVRHGTAQTESTTVQIAQMYRLTGKSATVTQKWGSRFSGCLYTAPMTSAYRSHLQMVRWAWSKHGFDTQSTKVQVLTHVPDPSPKLRA